MNIVSQGYQAKQVNQIISIELEASDNAMNWQRRLRIAAGNVQQLLVLKHLLQPKFRGVAFTFASCKALRVTMPIWMLIAFIGSLVLASSHWVYACLAFVQFSLYLTALLQIALIKHPHNKLLNMLAYLVTGHAAMLVGGMKYLLLKKRTPWKSVTTPYS
jgi:hypothetical protein